MMEKEAFVAGKYARAYLQVFGNELTLQDFKAFEKLKTFLSHHKRILFFIELRHIDQAAKHTILQSVFDKLNIPHSFMRVIDLLLKDKRSFLLEDVVEQVTSLYKELKQLVPITITTSHQLNEINENIIERFIAQKTGRHVLARQAIDPTLIAGLRIQSDTLLWEYSVRKHLQQIRN